MSTAAHRPLPFPVADSDREARTARIEEIARLVAAGRYRVPADAVAAAFLEFHRRDGRR